MVNSLPTLPTWFITLSSRDLEWHDMLRALLKAKNINDPQFDPDEIDMDELSYQQRNQLLTEYPVIAARHFDHRFKAFLNYIKSNDQVLGGKLIHHWYRVEFQVRGSPHIHMIVWIKDAPQFDTQEGLILIMTINNTYRH